jgi:hypothetical protein
LDISFDPGKRYFANGYAHKEAIIIWPIDPTITTKSELNKYLENGTRVFDNTRNKS